MDLRAIENKIKKKAPNIYLIDIKPIDVLDSVLPLSKTCKDSMNAKDLYLLDIQTMICHIFLNQWFTTWPRWCRLMKPANFSYVHLIVLEGFSSHMWSECFIKYSQHKKFKKYSEELLLKLNKCVKFVSPSFYGLSWKLELLEILNPFLSKNFNIISTIDSKVEIEKSNLKRKFMAAFTQNNDFVSLIRQKYNINIDTEFRKEKDAFQRTELLMNVEQMKQERIPLESDKNPKFANFKYSRLDGYDEVTPKSPLFAIDCEMVECYDAVTNKCVKGLASVSIINEDRETVYQTFVKPKHIIVNYLTPYSGITYEIMANTNRTLEDVQRDIAQILPRDAILVGHSISNDLEALQLFHPYLIDTSVIYNLKHFRNLKPKLKLLSEVFLNREIQCAGLDGHDSQEDAIATMDLVLLKLSRSLEFGDLACPKIKSVPNQVVGNEISDEQHHQDQFTQLESDKVNGFDKKKLPTEMTIEIPDLVVHTTNAVHLRHKTRLTDLYERKECINLLKCVDRYSVAKVASVNDDMSGFSKEWAPLDFIKQSENEEKVEKNDISVSNTTSPYLCISEISSNSLHNDELPDKKWMSRLMKKILKEFDCLPPNAFCGLILADGPYSIDKPDSEYGKFLFGISSYLPKVEALSSDV